MTTHIDDVTRLFAGSLDRMCTQMRVTKLQRQAVLRAYANLEAHLIAIDAERHELIEEAVAYLRRLPSRLAAIVRKVLRLLRLTVHADLIRGRLDALSSIRRSAEAGIAAIDSLLRSESAARA